jgi:GAF domain-containing protein
MTPAEQSNEEQRLATLSQLDILNGESEERFDRITRVLAALFDVPVAMVNFIGADVQTNKSCFGMDSGMVMDKHLSFCNHTIISDDPLIIRNALEDDRFKDNPNVKGGLNVRAYAGVPLHAIDGTRPGALCLIDTKPREFTEADVKLLLDMSAWAEIELNSKQLREALDQVSKSKIDAEKQLEETKRLNELMVGRELKMVEMKKQIEELNAKLGAQQV